MVSADIPHILVKDWQSKTSFGHSYVKEVIRGNKKTTWSARPTRNYYGVFNLNRDDEITRSLPDGHTEKISRSIYTYKNEGEDTIYTTSAVNKEVIKAASSDSDSYQTLKTTTLSLTSTLQSDRTRVPLDILVRVLEQSDVREVNLHLKYSPQGELEEIAIPSSSPLPKDYDDALENENDNSIETFVSLFKPKENPLPECDQNSLSYWDTRSMLKAFLSAEDSSFFIKNKKGEYILEWLTRNTLLEQERLRKNSVELSSDDVASVLIDSFTLGKESEKSIKYDNISFFSFAPEGILFSNEPVTHEVQNFNPFYQREGQSNGDKNIVPNGEVVADANHEKLFTIESRSDSFVLTITNPRSEVTSQIVIPSRADISSMQKALWKGSQKEWNTIMQSFENIQ